MKKLTTTTALLIICFVSAFSQPCPDSLYITSQAQIDSFQINYHNCNGIEGDVNITGNDITNLNGLSILTSIGGSLEINNNNVLTSLTGLNNVISIGGFLSIRSNSTLTSLAGLENIDAGSINNCRVIKRH